MLAWLFINWNANTDLIHILQNTVFCLFVFFIWMRFRLPKRLHDIFYTYRNRVPALRCCVIYRKLYSSERLEESHPSVLLGFDVGASARRWIPVGAAPVDGKPAACGTTESWWWNELFIYNNELKTGESARYWHVQQRPCLRSPSSMLWHTLQ